jgi:peptide/nickel transport system permease protein
VSFGRFFLVRLGWAALGLCLAVNLAFVVSLLPTPPRERIICGGERARTSCLDDNFQDFDVVHTIPERYQHFLSLMVRDRSPGVSRLSGQDTGRMARTALPVTASVVTLGLVLALAAAVLLALLRRPFARLPGYVAGGSLATFLFGIWVFYLFGFRLGQPPPTGYCDAFGAHSDCGGAFDWLSHVLIPAGLLAIFPAAVYARLLREGRFLLRKSEEAKHAGRRLALPLVRVAGRDFGFLIGAAVFVETAFSLPGLGQMVAIGTSAYDKAAVQAALVYAAVLAIAVHFLVDLIVGALDSDLRADWPAAAMPSTFRVSAAAEAERFGPRREPASKRRRLFGMQGP